MNLTSLFAIGQERQPDKIAIEFVDTRGAAHDCCGPLAPQQLTFTELQLQADTWATVFLQMGVQKGDRIALYLGSRPEFVIAYLAALRVGAVMVPINLRYRKRELTHILSDAAPVLLITEDTQKPVLDALSLRDGESMAHMLSVDQAHTWQSLPTPGPQPQFPLVHGEDPALIMYTSGTTGPSKGAVLSHNNVLATVTGLQAAWAWAHDDVLLLTLPLFHIHGLVVGLHCALAMGATIRLRSGFDLAETLEILSTGGATLFFAVPTIYIRMVNHFVETDSRPDFPTMRLFCSGSAPLPSEIHHEFERLTGQRILERYGMTETGMNFSNPYAGPRIAGTIGTPLPGVFARIVDESGRDVLAGEEGELLLRGSNVFDGYWRAAEKTAASFVRDELGNRWFLSGDLARMDPETGYVTLLGRRHELIISGGLNIYPREVEEVLTTFPGIEEAAVIAEADPEWGEVPVAYVVGSTRIDVAAVEQYCRGQLASYKCPQKWHFVEALPRNAMGKIQKHLLP